MALDYTVDAVITAVLARCYENTGAFTTAKVLRLMNEELVSYLLPFLDAARTDLFTTHVDVPLIANQQGYPVPPGGMASKLRSISIVDSSGNVQRQLYELDIDQANQNAALFNLNSLGNPTNYYFEGEKIMVWPTPINIAPNGLYAIRFYYSRRPNELILKAGAQQIVATSQVGGNTRFQVANSGIFTNGQTLDLVMNQPPFGAPLTTVIAGIPDGTHVDMTGLLSGYAASAIGVGDWLCPTGQAPVPTNVPGEIWVGLFEQWMVAQLMSARADDQAYKRALQNVRISEGRTKIFLRQRNKGDVHQLQSQPYRFKGGLGGMRRSF